MPDQPTPVFKFDDWLADRNMSFSRRADDGTVFVNDPTGQEKPFNISQLKTDVQAKTGMKDMAVQFNTAQNPVQISPVGLSDRGAIAFGNTKGATTYLQKKFDGVEYNPDHGLVVNNKGVWQTVDPSGLGKGTAWDKTKELFKDIVDHATIPIAVASTTVGATEGAAMGAAAGGVATLGPGALPGAIAGGIAGGIVGSGAGGLASGTIRTTFGRMLGTYESTPEETVKDVGLETIMAMGGQAAAPGFSHGIEMLGKAGSAVGKAVPDVVKGTFANVYGRITGVGTEAMYSLMGQGEKMMGKLKQLAGGAGAGASGDDIIAHAATKNIDTANTFLEEGVKALPRKYGQMLQSLVGNAEGKVNVNMEDLVSNTMGSIEQTGIGKFVPLVSKGGAKARNAIERAGAELEAPAMNLKHGQVKFVPYTQEEVAARWAQGLPAEVLEGESKGKVMKFVNQMLVLGKEGDLEGSAAANVLTRAKGYLNSVADDAFKSNDLQMGRLMAKAKEGWDNNVRQVFDTAGLGKEYSNLSGLYAQYGNAVNGARAILNRNGAEGFVKKIVSDSTKNLTAKGDTALLVDLLGERGKQLHGDILLTDSAAKFAPWLPRFGPVGRTGLVGAASLAGTLAPGAVKRVSAAVGLAGTGAAALATGTQFSPKIVAGQVRVAQMAAQKAMPYLNKSMDFVKSMGPKQLKDFVSNPQMMEAFMRTVPAAVMQQDQDSQQALTQTGVKPPQQ